MTVDSDRRYITYKCSTLNQSIFFLECYCPKKRLLRCTLAAANVAYFDHKKHGGLHEPCLFALLYFSIM